MAITDLTGTTWRINDVPVIGSSVTYDINFSVDVSGFTIDYTKLRLNTTPSIDYSEYQSDWVGVYDSRGWTHSDFQTIMINDGTDVTNATLIAWFKANATQLQKEIAYTTTIEELTSIANAIRSKTGSQSNIKYPDGFITEISNL